MSHLTTAWRPPSRKEWAKRLPWWWPRKTRRCVPIDELPWWLQRRVVLEEVVCIDGWCVKREYYRVCIYPWPKQFALA